MIADLRQRVEPLIEIHLVRLPSRRPGSFVLSSPLRGRPRLRFGVLAFGFGAGVSRASMAVGSLDTWPMSASPSVSATRAACILSGRRDCDHSANARENVASLGISTTRDQPHSRRNVGSTLSLSIRWRVVGRSHTTLAMKPRARPGDPPGADPDRSTPHRRSPPP